MLTMAFSMWHVQSNLIINIHVNHGYNHDKFNTTVTCVNILKEIECPYIEAITSSMLVDNFIFLKYSQRTYLKFYILECFV